MIEEATAAGCYELGRRWVYLHHVFTPPLEPKVTRDRVLSEFLSLGATLNVPIDLKRLKALLGSPAELARGANAYFNTIAAGLAIARGADAGTLASVGASVTSAAFSKAGVSGLRGLERSLGELMTRWRVPAKEQKALLKRLGGLAEAKHTDTRGEHSVSSALGLRLAKAVSQGGIRSGSEIIPNVVDVSGGGRIHLPKRLVGYRQEVEAFLKSHPYEQNVFLMMPFREATVALRTQLRRTCSKYKLHLVVADEHRIVDNDLNANVLACLLSSRYGIAIFARPETKQTVNPNVAYELGLMHRDDKVCLILKDKRLDKLPTDLIGHLYVDYAPRDSQGLVSQVETWIQDRVLGA